MPDYTGASAGNTVFECHDGEAEAVECLET